MFKNIKKIERNLDIPESIIDDIVKVTCIGSDKVLVENYIGILEYDSCEIRLNTGNGDVYVYGESLVISELSKDDLVISGRIYMVEFER